MVEALSDDSALRATTPTPSRISQAVASVKEKSLDLDITSRAQPDFYEGFSSGSLITDSEPDKTGCDLDLAPDSMDGNAREHSDTSMPNKSNAANRRRSRSQSSSLRPSRPMSSPALTTHGYVPLPPNASDNNTPNTPNVGVFQGSPFHYPPGAVPYSARPGYVGQYTISPPPALTMAHTPPPFAYSHSFHHSGVADGSMISPSIHASYPSMLQPLTPVYQYQRHSPEGATPSRGPFPGSRFAHQVNLSPGPNSPLSTPVGQNAAHSASFVGALQYPSPLSTPQYAYPTHSFPTSPSMYPPQYGSPYGQAFSSPQEAEHQGTWWYMPRASPLPPQQQQYDNTPPPYPSHYPMSYVHMEQRDLDVPYTMPSSASGSQQAFHLPNRHSAPPSREDQPSSSPVPRTSGVGPPPNQDTGGSSSSGDHVASERLPIRRSYHPNPPPHRSEWVMWAGNVPSDASHVELWQFFNQPESEDKPITGVVSIFLIARSNCAFVNFADAASLHAAIARFHGMPLRSNDPRCQRLVCRERKKDDDLKAGVGGQRGMGLHVQYVKDMVAKGKGRGTPSDVSQSDGSQRSPSSVSESLNAAMASFSVSSDDEAVHQKKHDSSSGSFASTNSSILSRYFPKRYFILKSLTQEDLDTSVENGLWATQRHNEGILDQAYRTSREVFLIFSVNKSGEFYGYARMTGPVRRGEHRVSWAARTESSQSSRSSHSPVMGKATQPTEQRSSEGLTSPEKSLAPPNFFSPGDGRLVDSSPLPVDGSEPLEIPGTTSRIPRSAPAELGKAHTRFSIQSSPSFRHSSLDPVIRRAILNRADDSFELDESAPFKAIRSGSVSTDAQGASISSGAPGLQVVAEEEEKGEEEKPVGAEDGMNLQETWGDCFRVDWIRTARLPFYRTRHLRNPWNHDREIKVSRDGTELEPIVGERLLEEWMQLSEQLPVTVAPGKPTGSKRGASRTPGVSGTQLGESKEGRRREGGPSRS